MISSSTKSNKIIPKKLSKKTEVEQRENKFLDKKRKNPKESRNENKTPALSISKKNQRKMIEKKNKHKSQKIKYKESSIDLEESSNRKEKKFKCTKKKYNINKVKKIDKLTTKESSGSNYSNEEKDNSGSEEKKSINIEGSKSSNDKNNTSSTFEKFDDELKKLRNFVKEIKDNHTKEIKEIKDNHTKEIKEIKDNYTKEIKGIKNDIKILNIKNEINIQEHKILNGKINSLVNTFKVLYFRKLCDLVLDRIINKYNNKLAKSEKIFGHEKNKFCIIFAQSDIENISKVKINLLIDFLRYIKYLASKIIHFRKLNGIIIEKEVFYELLDIYKGSASGESLKEKKGIIKITDIGNILFNLNNDDEKKDERKIKKIEKDIDKFIEVQEKKEEEEGEEEEGKEEDDDENDDNVEEDSEKEKEDDEKEEEEKIYEKVPKKEKEEEDADEKRDEDGEEDENSDDLILEKLKIIMSEKNFTNKIKISNLLKKLKEKYLNANEKSGNDINIQYFYKEWNKSFKIFKYKNSENYKNLMSLVSINKKMITIEEMKIILNKLLKNEIFNFFEKDPEYCDDSIKKIIKLKK